jgi:hypothetical protein
MRYCNCKFKITSFYGYDVVYFGPEDGGSTFPPKLFLYPISNTTWHHFPEDHNIILKHTHKYYTCVISLYTNKW